MKKKGHALGGTRLAIMPTVCVMDAQLRPVRQDKVSHIGGMRDRMRKRKLQGVSNLLLPHTVTTNHAVSYLEGEFNYSYYSKCYSIILS